MEGRGGEWSGGEGKVGRGFSRYYDGQITKISHICINDQLSVTDIPLMNI